MPRPKAICIEDVAAKSDEARFLRCVALAGRGPGLRVDAKGDVLWKTDEGVAFELWVSADERLILYRPEGAAPVALHRAGRSLDVPFGKPVIAIDGDEVDVGARRLRIHVHGEATAVSAPSAFVPERSALGRLARAAAAAAAIGTGVGGCSVKDFVRDIVVRDAPPEVALPDEPETDAGGGKEEGDGGEGRSPDAAPGGAPPAPQGE